MTASVIPPALILIVGGLALPLLPARVRPALLMLAAARDLYLVWQVPDGPRVSHERSSATSWCS